MSAKMKADELARLILQSSEFRNLTQAKSVVDRNSAYKNSLQTLKSKEMELHKIMMPDPNKGKAKIKEIENYYNQLIKNPDIKRYMDAEKAFNEYVAGILKIVNDSISNSLK